MQSSDKAGKPATNEVENSPEQAEAEATAPQAEAPKNEAEALAPADEEDQKSKGMPSESAENVAKKAERLSPQKRKNQPTLQQVTARFAGCGRCSYFWAGYRVIQGVVAMETAVAESKSGWLQLVWDAKMPDLIYKTFGVRLDISHFHYEGCCKECCRHFVYRAAENEEEEYNTFRIEISPQTSK